MSYLLDLFDGKYYIGYNKDFLDNDDEKYKCNAVYCAKIQCGKVIYRNPTCAFTNLEDACVEYILRGGNWSCQKNALWLVIADDTNTNDI